MSHTNTEHLNGEEAVALGALLAGVEVVTGYPGSPTKGVFEALQRFYSKSPTRPHAHTPYFEWSVNEKVALEVALGATLAGKRAMMCCKSVGMNVALDALMCLNMSGCPSPLVIVLGDDPGAWQSQNEQDSRWLALMSELPLLEPCTVQDAIELTRYAFELSEREQLPVIVRIVRNFAHHTEAISYQLSAISPNPKSQIPNPKPRSLAQGALIRGLHEELREKLRRIAAEWENLPLNRIENGSAPNGVIAVGFGYQALREVMAELSIAENALAIFKLSTSHPLSAETFAGFLSGKSAVVVMEENEPVVEMQVRSLAQQRQIGCQILGKLDGTISRGGELTPRRIARALAKILPLPADRVEQLPDPFRKTMLEGGREVRFCNESCPYPVPFVLLKEVCEELGLTYTAGADPGCAVLAVYPPYEFLTVKHSMGSAVNILKGLAQADPKRRCIAVVGDSDFFHGALLGIINAVYTGANLTVVLFDNSGAAFTGCQPHPGMGFKASRGDGETFYAPAPTVTIERLLEAAGVRKVWTQTSRDEESLRAIFRQALTSEGVNAVVIREPCPFAPIVTEHGIVEPSKEGKIVGE